MSNFNELIERARSIDPDLAKDLESEVRDLNSQRKFGLVFERHLPESVNLPGRKVRRGSKVRLLPPRGETTKVNQCVWTVKDLDGNTASLRFLGADKQVEETEWPVDDLVAVAEFNDVIYPGLVPDGEVNGGDVDDPAHVVINAENYHALEMFTYTHRGSIDCIYIDPPYNTGKDEWIYSDRYIEPTDDYRHSKWLAFMERRLRLARELLSPTGVIIVAIGNEQQHRLRMLMDQIFGETNFLSNVAWNGGRKNDSRFVSNGEDYMLVFAKDKTAWIKQGVKVKDAPDVSSLDTASDIAKRGARWRVPKEGYEAVLAQGKVAWREARQTSVEELLGADSEEFSRLSAADGDDEFDSVYEEICDRLSSENQKRLFRLAEFDGEKRMREFYRQYPPKSPLRTTFGRYNYFLPDGTLCRDDNITWPGGGGPEYDVLHPETGKPVPVPDSGWRFPSSERMQEIIDEGQVIFRKTHSSAVSLKKPLEKTSSNVLMSTFDRQRTHGTRQLFWNVKGEVRGVFAEDRFPNPKDVTVLADWIEVCTPKDGVVLDFFGGSGSTLEAVAFINERSNSHRRAIIVTNNEVGRKQATSMSKAGLRKGDAEWETHGIYEYVTKPRTRTVITGRREDNSEFSDGMRANAKFFILTYEDPLAIQLSRGFTRIAPLLWLRAGQHGPVIDDLTEKGYGVSGYYGVIESLDYLDNFIAEVENKRPNLIYIITDDRRQFQHVAGLLPSGMETVRLYESYLSNFEVNTGRYA